VTHHLDPNEPDLPAFEPEPIERKAKPSAEYNQAGVELALRLLRRTHEAVGHVIDLLEGAEKGDAAARIADLVATKQEAERFLDDMSGGKTIEGVFDGVSMVGEDGCAYPVPANYASKSRLVEGDVLKLSSRADGTRVFKQIGPVERKSLVGRVEMDASTGTHVVTCGRKAYKVLPASITFFRAGPGDEAVVLIPKSRDSVWAALESITKK
jgi:hypothetical protein